MWWDEPGERFVIDGPKICPRGSQEVIKQRSFPFLYVGAET